MLIGHCWVEKCCCRDTMDISPARLAALLRQAMKPPAVPSAKADPVKTALVKALVAPPAPSGPLVRRIETPALPMLFQATAAKAQHRAAQLGVASRVDEGAAARPASLPWLALLSPVVSPPRRAPIANAATTRGRIASQPGDSARLDHRRACVGLMSLAAGLSAAAVVGFVLLVLR
jgi:hypothetical protein